MSKKNYSKIFSFVYLLKIQNYLTEKKQLTPLVSTEFARRISLGNLTNFCKQTTFISLGILCLANFSYKNLKLKSLIISLYKSIVAYNFII